jgi:EipB-like/TIR domain
MVARQMDSPVFVSFASKDRKVATSLCDALENRGIGCWISSRNIRPGDNFQVAIVRAIRAAKVMVLVFSGNSNNSDEVKKELVLAGQSRLVVIPVRVEDVAPSEAFAYEFATRQWIDLFGDWELSIRQLADQIEAVVESSPAKPPPSEEEPPVRAPPAASLPVTAIAVSAQRTWRPGLLVGVVAAIAIAAGAAFWLRNAGRQPTPEVQTSAVVPRSAPKQTASTTTPPSPAVQAPTAQAPTAQTPTAQAPTAQTPTAQTPTAQTPTAQTPTAQTPAAQSPIAAPVEAPKPAPPPVAPPLSSGTTDESSAASPQPHHASYRMTLDSVSNASGPSAASGTMDYRWGETCDGWTVDQTYKLLLSYPKSANLLTGFTFSTWESKDGLRYRFYTRETRNGAIDAEIRGTAQLDGAGEGGTATFTQPKSQTVDLPAGTLFPSAHAILLMERAAAGDSSVSREVFEGSSTDGAQRAIATIGKRIGPGSQADQPDGLAQHAGWPVRLAFFDAKSDKPAYQWGMVLLDNGVMREITIDYGSSAVGATLEAIQPLDKPHC